MSESLTYWIDSSGAIVQAPPPAPGENYADLLPASDKQIADFKLQQKYGGAGQQTIAGIEGLGRGLTLGASTAIERGLGVDPEGIAGREEANPITAGVSEAVGVAAPLVSTLGGAAPFTGPALAARTGAAAARALAPEGATVAARILGRAGAAAAGSAVEGAFYGAGRVVHEAALGDPNMTAQSALATVGTTAALFGGLSGAAKLFGGAVAEYTPKMLGEKVGNMLAEAEAHANFNATNAMPAQIKKVMRGKGEGATAIGLEGRDLGILKNPIADSPDAILERATAVKTEAGRAMDHLAEQATRGEALTSWEAIDKDVREPMLKALRSQGATMQVADQFDALMNRYAEAYQGRALGVKDLWEIRKDFDSFIYKNGKVLDPWGKELNSPVARVREHVDQLVENGIKDASGTDALKAWQTANRQFEVGATFATLAQNGIERSAANNAVHLTGTLGALAGFGAHGAPGAAILGTATEAVRRRGASAIGMGARALRNLAEPAEALTGKTVEAVSAARQAGAAMQPTTAPASVTVLAALERTNQEVERKIDSAARALVLVGKRTGAVARAEAEGAAAKTFGEQTDSMKTAYVKRVAQIQRFANDPEQLHQALVAQTGDWQDHAPRTALAMQTASARAVTFLSSRVPQSVPTGPLGKAPEPSRAEMAKFNRYFDAVEKPLEAMRHPTPEAIEALAAVHPELLDKMRMTAMEHMTQAKTTFQAKQRASVLMGQDLDGRSSPIAIQAAMMPFAPPPPKAPKGLPPATRDRPSLSDRTMTPMQRVAAKG